jgi:hypothetical protein
MKRIAILVALSAASTTAALVLAAPASTTRATSTNLKPTSAAINHWKGIVLKPANLPPFWRGYLKDANLDTCKMKRSSGVTYYNCHIPKRRYGARLREPGPSQSMQVRLRDRLNDQAPAPPHALLPLL